MGMQASRGLHKPAQQMRPARAAGCRPLAAAKPQVMAAAAEQSPLQTAATYFVNLFPLWNLFGAVLALKQPAAYSFMSTEYFTVALSVLMFSMGITMTLDDFKRCLSKPGPIALNFLACYGMMPALAWALGYAFGLSPPLIAGCVLVGSINGGQASNLCTYIAKVRSHRAWLFDVAGAMQLQMLCSSVSSTRHVTG